MAEPNAAALALRDAVSTLSAFAWIDATSDGLVAFLLLAPTVPDVSRDDMAALADAIGLDAPASALPDIGPRVSVRHTTATLWLPELGRALRIEVPDEWSQLVNQGGTVVLLAGADHFSPGSPRTEVEAYMRARLVTDGQLWLGKTRRQFSAEQLAGAACLDCASREAPLHPAGTVTVEDSTPGVVHDHDVVRCTECVSAPRYVAALLPRDEKGRVLWGIRDMARGGAWVENGGELVQHALESGANDWIRRQRYLNETATFRA